MKNFPTLITLIFSLVLTSFLSVSSAFSLPLLQDATNHPYADGSPNLLIGGTGLHGLGHSVDLTGTAQGAFGASGHFGASFFGKQLIDVDTALSTGNSAIDVTIFALRTANGLYTSYVEVHSYYDTSNHQIIRIVRINGDNSTSSVLNEPIHEGYRSVGTPGTSGYRPNLIAHQFYMHLGTINGTPSIIVNNFNDTTGAISIPNHPQSPSTQAPTEYEIYYCAGQRWAFTNLSLQVNDNGVSTGDDTAFRQGKATFIEHAGPSMSVLVSAPSMGIPLPVAQAKLASLLADQSAWNFTINHLSNTGSVVSILSATGPSALIYLASNVCAASMFGYPLNYTGLYQSAAAGHSKLECLQGGPIGSPQSGNLELILSTSPALGGNMAVSN